jgi:BirA family transcriptional regulator, biotin operon repressor / biotin---[acetyl-CoA-carboxylase] ligase
MNSHPHIVEIEECESTQNLALELLRQHEDKDFIAVRARRQTQGRGRQERSWVSEEGNLFLSSAFRIDRATSRSWPFASLLAGACVAQALDAAGCWDNDCFIKWPNDLYGLHEGRFKKFGGILSELKKNVLIIGVGLNVESSPRLEESTYASTSLRDRQRTSQALPNASELSVSIVASLKILMQTWLLAPEPTSAQVIEDLSLRWMKPFWGQVGHVETLGPARAIRLFADGRLLVSALHDSTLQRTLSAGEFQMETICAKCRFRAVR